MTAPTAQPGVQASAPNPGQGHQPGITRLVQAEFLKLFTTRMWWGLMIVAAAFTTLNSVAIAAFAGNSFGGSTDSAPTMPGPDDPAILRSIYGTALTAGYVVLLVIGILGMTGEYRHRTITSSLLGAPRRGRLVAAKLLAYFLIGLAGGAALTLVAMITGGTTLAIRGYGLGLGADGVLRTVALAILGVGIWTVFGLGLGALIRNQIAAIVVALATQLLLEGILQLILNAVHWGAVAKFLPSAAASAMISGSTNSGTGIELQILPWWGGALVLGGYGVVFAVLGWLLLNRRDVT